MNREESDNLNKAIREICEDHSLNDVYTVKGLEDTSKCIPYIGWYWRTVYFDLEDIQLGFCADPNGKHFVGFMENNKWDYEQWYVEDYERDAICEELAYIVEEPTQDKLQAFFDYVQTCVPDWLDKTICPHRERPW